MKDGTRVTCATCGSHLGDLAGNDSEKHYQLNSIALDFEESKLSGLLEDAQDQAEGILEEENEKKEAPQPPAKSAALTVIFVVIGLAAGVALGAGGYATLVCQAPAAGQMPAGAATPTASSTPNVSSSSAQVTSGGSAAAGSAMVGGSGRPTPTSTAIGPATSSASGTASSSGTGNGTTTGGGTADGTP